MFNKKAQTGSTLTWFVGFLIIVFIIFLFIAMSFAGTVVQRMTDGKSEIDSGEAILFQKSEQQRQMFALFENEFEGRENYRSIQEFIKKLQRNKLMSSEETGRIANLVNNQKIKDICLNFSIIDLEITGPLVPLSFGRTFQYDRIYYFEPLESKSKKVRRGGTEIDHSIITNSYSFFFPEKPFALIKYIQTKCPETTQ
jgi:hypothetical protein